jgi:phosphoribosylamine--glycine ligase
VRALVLDAGGNGLDWCLRTKRAGHDVVLYIPDKPRLGLIGRGLVKRVANWREWVRWADLVFLTDNTAYLGELRRVMAALGASPAVFGATEESSEWELDRDRGMSLFRSEGIAIPPSREFNDYDKAIAYVKKEDRAFVSKPSGDADKALSYVSKTPEDLVFMLQRWKRLGKIKSPFILQEKVNGTEMAVGGWIGPNGFAPGWCENWEFKKLMDGERGVATGEQGTILRYCAESKLADEVLAPFESAIIASAHTGYVDVNCIITDNGTPYPLEWTMRCGWPTFNIQQAVHDGDPAEWMLDLARGGMPSHAVMDTVAAGVVMSIPDYPYNKYPLGDVSEIPIYGIKPSKLHNLHPCEMAMGMAPARVNDVVIDATPMMVTAGTYVLVASGDGGTVEEARRHAYQCIESVSLPNSPMYRGDIGRRLQSQLPKLQANGYAIGLTYKAD